MLLLQNSSVCSLLYSQTFDASICWRVRCVSGGEYLSLPGLPTSRHPAADDDSNYRRPLGGREFIAR